MASARARRITALGLAALAMGGGCSAPSKQAGGLEIVVATNLAMPGEFDTLQARISQQSPDGGWNRLLDADFPMTSQASLPRSLSIAAGASSDQVALIDLIASKNGAPLVFDEALVQVPTDRLAELDMFVTRDCSGQVVADPDGTVRSSCGPGQTCQSDTGTCGPTTIDPSNLPPYSPGDVAHADAGSTAHDAATSAGDGAGADGPTDDGLANAPGADGPIAEGAVVDDATLDVAPIDSSPVDVAPIDSSPVDATSMGDGSGHPPDAAGPPPPRCGDGTCNANESCDTCPTDCDCTSYLHVEHDGIGIHWYATQCLSHNPARQAVWQTAWGPYYPFRYDQNSNNTASNAACGAPTMTPGGPIYPLVFQNAVEPVTGAVVEQCTNVPSRAHLFKVASVDAQGRPIAPYTGSGPSSACASAAAPPDPCRNVPFTTSVLYCGGETQSHFDPMYTEKNTIYNCQNGVTIGSTVCPNGCNIAPFPTADTCN